jgi:hypothetical protein
MSARVPPIRYANELTVLLDTVLGVDRFPVDVPTVALEVSRQRFPDDPIAVVRGERLSNFDGALYRAPAGKSGWGIFYNSAISSKGRINFTLGHEFGHYLLHRLDFPKGQQGIECGDRDVIHWDSEFGQIEAEANIFSAYLLMPLNDFRRQIGNDDAPDLGLLSACAERYRVSLVAAILRWLEYTTRRAVLVVSRDSFIWWARSSRPALRSGAFFRTSGAPIAIPRASIVGRQDKLIDGRKGVDLGPGVWLREPVREMTIFADQYDFAVTLLLLPSDCEPVWHDDEPELQNTYERFQADR